MKSGYWAGLERPRESKLVTAYDILERARRRVAMSMAGKPAATTVFQRHAKCVLENAYWILLTGEPYRFNLSISGRQRHSAVLQGDLTIYPQRRNVK